MFGAWTVELPVPDYFMTQDLIAENTPAFTSRLFDRSVLVVGLGGNGCHVALAAVLRDGCIDEDLY
jgi:hypothetical protein